MSYSLIICLATTAAGWGIPSLFIFHRCVVNYMQSCCCRRDAAVVRWDLSPEYHGSNDKKKRTVLPKHLRAGRATRAAQDVVQADFVLVMNPFWLHFWFNESMDWTPISNKLYGVQVCFIFKSTYSKSSCVWKLKSPLSGWCRLHGTYLQDAYG